jgi:methionyl-tRNA formyltransferase
MNKNFVFWGTPDVASGTLEILKQAGCVPSLIVTSPDKPQGRKMLFTPPPAKVWAEKNNIPYIQPDKLLPNFLSEPRDSAGSAVRNKKNWEGAKPDLFIVVAYGKIIPEDILKMPRLGSINIHYSLLPKYRGASPVESAILNGDTETGVTIQQMEFKMDAGAILAQEKVAILPDEKASELRTRLIKIGGDLLVKTLPNLEAIKPIPQDEAEATHCSKIKKEDGLIDLNADGTTNYNKFRAYATWPRTFFFRDGKRIIVTDATLEDGKFVIKKVIPEGGKEMEYKD